MLWAAMKTSLFPSVCILLLALMPVRPAPAADWPQFRGPNRDGVSKETDLLKEWPADGPKLAWKIEGLGAGYSSVAVVGGKVYTMGARDDGEYVLAIDAATQKVLWATRVGEMFKDSHGDGPRCTPTVDGDRLYALGAKGDLVCLETASGKEVWHKSLPTDFGGKMMSMWGWCESPLIDGDKLICTPGVKDAVMVALDKKTGSVIWKAARPPVPEADQAAQAAQEDGKKGKGNADKEGAGYASIAVSEGAGVRQYIAFTANGLVGVAAKDGRYLWFSARPANGTANCSMPVVRGDYVFASSAYGAGSVLLQLSASDGGVNAKEVYSLDSKTFMSQHGGVVLVGDYLYGHNGHGKGLPTCLEFATGNIAWRAPASPGAGSGSVTAADGLLFFHYEDGHVALVQPAPGEYKQLSVFSTPGQTKMAWAYPAVSAGRLYIREGDALYCYDVK